MGNLVVGHRDPRQVRDTADGGGIDGHVNGLFGKGRSKPAL
jgi:hypothetical protein